MRYAIAACIVIVFALTFVSPVVTPAPSSQRVTAAPITPETPRPYPTPTPWPDGYPGPATPVPAYPPPVRAAAPAISRLWVPVVR